jgi:hypothetical protein
VLDVVLAAVLAAGTKATSVPDLASQHIEQAKTVLVRELCLLGMAHHYCSWAAQEEECA